MIDPRSECPGCLHRAYHHEYVGCTKEVGDEWPPVYCRCERIWANDKWYVPEEEPGCPRCGSKTPEAMWWSSSANSSTIPCPDPWHRANPEEER